MFFKCIITRCKTPLINFVKNVSRSYFHDKHFDTFRSNAQYKNLIIQLDKDLQKHTISTDPDSSLALKEEDIQSEVFIKKLTQRQNVMQLSTSQVKDILGLMASGNIDTTKYTLPLKFLDEKCALSASRWPLDVSFYVLDAWCIIYGPKAFKKHFYSAITSQWSHRIRKCSKTNLILILYFIGLSKSAPPFLMEAVLDKMENVISDFTDEEIALACLSFFKCSKKVHSDVFLKRCCQSARNLLKVHDRFNAISILKCLRLCKHFDEKLLQDVRDYCVKEADVFNFIECTNFLALFSSQNTYDIDLYNSLEARVFSLLKSELEDDSSELDLKAHPDTRNRAKDLARFLWATTSLGHQLKEDTLNGMSQCIKKRFQLGEYELQKPVIVDTLQSFVLSNHYPADLFESALDKSTYKSIVDSDKAKPKYQLYFLEKSLAIEHPEITIHTMNLSKSIPKNLNKEIEERTSFKELINIMENQFPNQFRSCYIMPHIMIAGIFLSKPCESLDTTDFYENLLTKGIIAKPVQDLIKKDHEFFCIEILDPSVYAKNCEQPVGLMQTKLRQLIKLNFKVVALSPEDIIKLSSLKNDDIEKTLLSNLI